MVVVVVLMDQSFREVEAFGGHPGEKGGSVGLSGEFAGVRVLSAPRRAKVCRGSGGGVVL